MNNPIGFLILQISAISLLSNAFDITPLGVPPDLTSLYTGPNFECFDKSKILDFHQVNDNYCDCDDSSDEPGTSACPKSQFYCQNENYLPKYIHSSFVNDNVCDCCDGSDEYLSKNCTNTCSVLAESLNSKKNELYESFDQGYRKYREFIEDVDVRLTLKREETKKRLEKEAQTRKENEIRRKKEEAERKAEEAQREAEEARKLAEEEGNKQTQDTQDLKQKEDKVDEFDPDKEAEKMLLDENEEENEPKNEEIADKAEKVSDDQEIPVDENLNEEIVVPEVDYGPKNAFLMLAEKDPVECFEYSIDEYIYKLCPFENVYQTPKNGGSQTLLGSWSRWLVKAHVGSEPLVMLFSNGNSCWQGPTRSAKVLVTCGKDNKITDVSEPSRCEYQLKMESPAACYVPAQELLTNFKLSHDEL